MPITLTYDEQLSRVRVNATGLTAGSVRIERSPDGIRWATVRGGASLVTVAGVVTLDDYEFAADVENIYRVGGQTASIAPQLDSVWLKSIARPFLNRRVDVRDVSAVQRQSRAGVFDVVGRSLPVAVTDVRTSRRWTLNLWAPDADEAHDLDLVLASGDVLFVHVPRSGRLSTVPSGYVSVGDTTEQNMMTHDLALRLLTLPVVEVAPPGPDVVGATSTWQTVLSTYPTWADLLAANATWAGLLELIGTPSDVIVP